MNLSLSKISFLNIIVTALVFSAVIGVFTIILTNSAYEEKIKQQKQTYIKKNRELVKREVLSVVKRVDVLHKIFYHSLIEDLEEKVDFVSGIFCNSANRSLNKAELLTKYKNELDTLQWDNKSGYFYILDSDGVILYHATNSEYVGKQIIGLMKNNQELESFVKKTLSQNENIGAYCWTKPHTNNHKLHEKYVYAKKVEHLNIYIAAGIYKDELIRKVQEMIFEELEDERFGEDDYGYFWINDLDSNILLHPVSKELVGSNLKEFKTHDGQYFFQNINKLVLKQTAGYINYLWQRPASKEIDEKISYVHLIKEWNMIIGSGFYLTELKKIHEEESKALKDALYNNLQKIFLVLGILILLSLISALFISKRIRKIEESQRENLHMLQQYKLILDKGSVVSKTDTNGVITYANKKFTKISGYQLEEVIGSPHNIVRHPETSKNQFKKLWRTIKKGHIWTGLIKNRKKNGDSYYNNTTIVPIKDSDGTIVEYISAGSDVTELIEKRTQLRSIFNTDSLTGLGNRVSLIDFLNRNKGGVLALINIDRFKEINDIQGHDTGDKIIQEFGSRLFNFVADEGCTLYRVQADIFALYSLEYGVDELLQRVAEFMDGLGKKTYVSKESNIILTYTAGIASQNENLLSYADMALSEAKKKKVRIKIYEESMNNIQEYKQNISWVNRLHTALEEDRIVPFYQPIYNYHTGEIEKYECLMRLLENNEAISPFFFLDVAKKTKLYPHLSYKMVEKSIDKFASSSKEFSINFSVEDLMNKELMEFVYNYADQKGVFQRLVLEIVESEEIEDNDSITKIINKFKEVGVQIAIDDFGSGYSNYSYLITLKADYVKIDGSIIQHILEDERALEVVKSLVNFAKKSNMKTIAEFVSSKELDALVKSLGVDYAQGYHYGKAEPDVL